MNSLNSNWQQIKFANLPSPRIGSAMLYNPAQKKAMIFGGRDLSKGDVSELWSLDGLTLEQNQTSSTPKARSGMGIVWDEARNGAVMFGGCEHQNYLGDTWFFDGSNWVEQKAQTHPSPRVGMSMVFDAGHKQILLFGGTITLEESRNMESNDTWLWDGVNWKQQFPTSLPPLRTGHQMIYDRSRQVTLLFGGTVQGAVHDDTWIWDGTNWIEQHPAHHPTARSEFAMGYDEDRQQIVLFGGYSINGLENDTWTWDGQDWTQLQPINSPPVEIGLSPKMVYLQNKQMLILFSTFRKKTRNEKGAINHIARSEVWCFK